MVVDSEFQIWLNMVLFKVIIDLFDYEWCLLLKCIYLDDGFDSEVWKSVLKIVGDLVDSVSFKYDIYNWQILVC